MVSTTYRAFRLKTDTQKNWQKPCKFKILRNRLEKAKKVGSVYETKGRRFESCRARFVNYFDFIRIVSSVLIEFDGVVATEIFDLDLSQYSHEDVK